MRAVFTYFSILSFLFFLIPVSGIQAQSVQWISWEKAVELSQTDNNPKKIFVDVYTDWCGWCKRMDMTTFRNAEVAAYMQDKFYMVKMDAESKEPIEFQGKTFKYIPSGRKGYHELAAALLQGKLSYPTVVFLDENLSMLSPVPGYQTAKPFLQIARYFGDNIYKDQDWETYSSAGK